MIENAQRTWFSLLSVLLIFSPLADAQIISGKTNRAIAEQAIIDLHDGALVVRLKTKRNKIAKLEESLASPAFTASDKKRLQKELESTIEEKDKYNFELAESFNATYKFSAVYFMYDTSSVALKNGAKSGFLLDKNLEVDPTITITQDSFFVIYPGTLDATNTSGLEALIIMDSQFEVLPSPFPYNIRVNHFGRLFGLIFSPKRVIKRDAKKVVSKLDFNLNEFYKRTVAKP
jgi:hypothetical protein